MQSKFILVSLVALVASAQCRTILQQQPPPGGQQQQQPPPGGQQQQQPPPGGQQQQQPPPGGQQQQPPPPAPEGQQQPPSPQFAKGPVPPECEQFDAQKIRCSFDCPESTYQLECSCEDESCVAVQCNVDASSDVINGFDFICSNQRVLPNDVSNIQCNNQESLDKVGALNQQCAPPQIYNAINLWNPKP